MHCHTHQAKGKCFKGWPSFWISYLERTCFIFQALPKIAAFLETSIGQLPIHPPNFRFGGILKEWCSFAGVVLRPEFEKNAVWSENMKSVHAFLSISRQSVILMANASVWRLFASKPSLILPEVARSLKKFSPDSNSKAAGEKEGAMRYWIPYV